MRGRVNNNGPRTIRLNTIKDNNWVSNIAIPSGNYSGLGTLARNAIAIETNIGTLTLTPRDPTKLPIITCDVYHRYTY